MAPTQVVIMNITDKQREYCESLQTELSKLGVRVEFDDRNEKLGYKIREARMSRIPYMLVAGDNEVAAGTLSVQMRGGVKKENVSRNDFVKMVVSEISERRLEPTWLPLENQASAES
jgi:threonyl-tRNA synthetase